MEGSVLVTEYSQRCDVQRLREQVALGVREGAVAECIQPGTQHLLMPKSNRFVICTDGNSVFMETKPVGTVHNSFWSLTLRDRYPSSGINEIRQNLIPLSRRFWDLSTQFSETEDINQSSLSLSDMKLIDFHGSMYMRTIVRYNGARGGLEIEDFRN